MGRVYKALVRAEKWKDRDRPIGRPVRIDAETDRAEDQSNTFYFNADSRSSVSSPVNDNVAPDVFVSRASIEPLKASVTAEYATTAPSARKPRPVDSSQLRRISEPSTPAFEEPGDIKNIHSLNVDPHLASLTGADHPAVERYRTLAAKLLNLADRRKLKTMLITSAEGAEGKTTVAINIAWSLVKHSAKRVLLIDASLPVSSVDRALGFEQTRGWLNLIDGSCDVKESLFRLDPNGLYVMPTGKSPGRSFDALSSRLEDVIARIAPSFDIVIVDSLAILESTEAQRFASVLDGTVIVARAGHTHHRKVTAARKLVSKERRLGVVLNETEIDAEITGRGRRKRSLAGRLFGRER